MRKPLIYIGQEDIMNQFYNNTIIILVQPVFVHLHHWTFKMSKGVKHGLFI